MRSRLITILIILAILSALGVTVATAQTGTPEIIITEIMYDPNSAEDNWEWIEIYNAGTVSADLTGYVVDDFNSVAHGSANIAGGTLAAGGQGILYNADDVSAGDFAAAWGNVNLIPVTHWSALALNNSGDKISLWDSFASYSGDNVTHANAIDTVDYAGPGFTDPVGTSIYLTDLGADNNVGSNWATSTDGGTTPLFAGYTSSAAGGNVGGEIGSPGAPVVVINVVINEIMQNPAIVSDSVGEWFELYNSGSSDVDIDGWTVQDNDIDSFVINNGGPLLIPAGGFLVLGNNASSGINGGVTVDYEYSGMFLSNSADELVLLDGSLAEIDRVEYDGGPGFPDPNGASMSLSDPTLDNNVGSNWCTSTTPFGIGDLGTPGAANSCPPPPPPGGFCGDPATMIYDIQGSGTASPYDSQVHVIEGVVVGDFQLSSELNGFFVQEEDAEVDADPATSDGIFVIAPGAIDVSVGDVVRVQGTVDEFFGLTELTSVVSLTDCEITGTATAASVTLPLTSVGDWEAFEGMLINIPQTLYASGNFTQARFGEVDLSINGPLDNPTNVVAPGAPAIALQDLNDRSRIQLDDGSNVQNPLPLPPYLGTGNTLRTGDTLPGGITAVLSYAFGVYEIHPTQAVNFTRVNTRPEVPDVGGTIQVAAYNVLNYFTTIDTGEEICGPLGDQGCRGADTASEFTRQRDKIVTAISKLDADVVGLMEIENAPNNTPEADLVAGLNAATAPGTYDYIASGPIGGDAIRVAMLYQPASVTPLGGFEVLDSSDDPNFDDTLNRPMLTQSFVENATGAVFTVGVNHLKSKGSDCNAVGDPDTGDGQGNCNITRTNAAQAIVDYLATDPTGSGDDDFLVIGDMNSYAKEDPITTVKAGGYTDLIEAFVGTGFSAGAYSYNFFSQSGYLDHGLASETMTPHVTGAAFWHVNGDEPSGLDYNNYNQPDLYYPDEFRSSDHDPVIVGLEMTTEAEIMELINDVQMLYDDGVLNGGQANALTSKLENVLAKLAKGNSNAAANQLSAFINQVEAFVNADILATEQGDLLIKSATLLVEALN